MPAPTFDRRGLTLTGLSMRCCPDALLPAMPETRPLSVETEIYAEVGAGQARKIVLTNG
ncbi:hypothetical protein [Rhodoblastus sp.]|uniref:hypothetical protein n=1 Tax=Rhodoblastus sp. TaxID=1962975 RepID=UPI0026054523|nr:hypothetical protein [Rhodoblastus sp.]